MGHPARNNHGSSGNLSRDRTSGTDQQGAVGLDFGDKASLFSPDLQSFKGSQRETLGELPRFLREEFQEADALVYIPTLPLVKNISLGRTDQHLLNLRLQRFIGTRACLIPERLGRGADSRIRVFRKMSGDRLADMVFGDTS
jgi:hypothetical protein